MKFDQTYIAIRKRKLLEIVDLSFHVIRDYFAPLSILWLLGVIPFMLLNWWLIGWMASDYYDGEMLFVYLYVSMMLVTVESHVATTFMTNYLGQAIFAQRPTIWNAVKSTCVTNPYFLIVHGLLRLVIPTVLLTLVLDSSMERDSFVGLILLMTLFATISNMTRFSRPFASEILCLEKTPVWKKTGQINYGLRSSSLHQAASSELIGRAFLVSVLAFPLTCTVTGVLLLLDYVFNLYTTAEFLPLIVYAPIAMWLVAGVFSVTRFLSYIDVRIRQEGWEVELRLRAEALRLEKGGV